MAALLLVGILAIAGVFGGDDGDGDGGSQTETTATGGDTGDLTIVRLSPLEGASGASGQAVFAQTQDQPVLQINLTGLAPTSEDNIYIVWLYNSDRAAFPLARDKVTENGNLTGAAAIPNEIISAAAAVRLHRRLAGLDPGDPARPCSRRSTARACRATPARRSCAARSRRRPAARRRPAPTRSARCPPQGRG